MTPSVSHVVVTDNFAGVERYVTTVAAATAARGWQVRVVGGRAAEMRELLPRAVAWAPASTVAAAAAQIRRHPTDVVHAHMTKAEVAAALVPRHARIIATRHFAAPRGRNPLIAAATNVLAKRVATEIAISETVKNASGVPEMVVLLNAVPEVHGPRTPERTVVVAQRWESEKRTDDAIEIFERSGAADDGWRLVVHGAGSEAGALRQRVDRSPVRSVIEVAGFARSMTDVLARAGVLLATAENEPFGLVVAEAMAAGVPVVASGAGGHLETVGRVESARLYPPGDVAAGARRLREVVAMSLDAREGYGVHLRRWAAVHLGMDDHVDRLLEIYRGRRGTPR